MSHGRSYSQVASSTLLMVSCLSFSALGLAARPPVIGDIDVENNKNAVLGYPQDLSHEDILISRRQYLIDWNMRTRTPRWASWTLNKRVLGDVSRTNNFKVDQDLNEYLAFDQVGAVAPAEYAGSCVDRGHQVASGDRTQNISDNQATFYMTNIAPQSAFLNRRPWASFERFLRTAVLEQGKEIYILAGGSGPSLGTMGVNGNIHMQANNFKIAVIKPAGNAPVTLDEMRLLALEMPNVTSKGTNPITDRRQACDDSEHMMRIGDSNRQAYWRPYVVPLRRIETTSGLDLSHLADVPRMTDAEMSELIGGQLSRSFDSGNLMSILAEKFSLLD